MDEFAMDVDCQSRRVRIALPTRSYEVCVCAGDHRGRRISTQPGQARGGPQVLLVIPHVGREDRALNARPGSSASNLEAFAVQAVQSAPKCTSPQEATWSADHAGVRAPSSRHAVVSSVIPTRYR
jgi:hypothetical protein